MLQKLAFMIALDREKHFGQAAESCGVAQPTLSQGIQQLEEQFNVRLVNRSSRFLGFTQEGERLLVWARRLIGDAEAMRQDIQSLQNGVGAHIRIAAVPSAMPVIASITNTFQISNPTTRLTILMRPSDELVDLLHKREIDLGVTYIDNDPIQDVETFALYREQYSLLTTSKGPAGNKSIVTWREVAELPLCLLTQKFQQRRIMDGIFRSVAIEVSPLVETDSVVGLMSKVTGGNLACVVPTTLLESIDLDENLRAISIERPKTSHTIGLVLSKQYPVPASVQCLIGEAKSSRIVSGRAGISA